MEGRGGPLDRPPLQTARATSSRLGRPGGPALPTLASISLGEIVKGIELLAAGKRKKEIAGWFERLNRWSENRLLPPTGQVMREWGHLCARHQRKGRSLPVLDSLIAATALAHDLVLVTRNTADFPHEVPILNPWKQ